MSRKALVPLFAAAFLVAPAIDSAMAYTNLNSSRSNIYRGKHVTGTKGTVGTKRATTVKSSKSNTSDRMGGGGGKGTARATTVKSSKSNTSDRMGGGRGAPSGPFGFGR
jgi:hypothetical protein